MRDRQATPKTPSKPLLNETVIRSAPTDEIWFVPLGGTGEIGMNLSMYGHGGKWLAVDMGVTFGDEFVPGIDLVMADHIFLEEQADNLVGIVITHAHEDHIGAVALLWPDLRVPVYCTPFAAGFLHNKLREEGLDGEVPVIVVNPGDRLDLGPFEVEYVQMTHSIPEACMLAIRTAAGTIVHTGDWKLDPDPVVGPPANKARLKEIGDEGVLACISDSTNILTPGRSGSEGDVARSLVDQFAEFGGKIAVTCFASNVARMQSIAAAAAANGRQVALVGRSLWRILEVGRAVGYFQGLPPFLEAEEAYALPDRRVLFMCTGSQGEPRAGLARIASGNHPHAKLGAGDVCFFSSRVIPGNEKAIFRVQNQLVRNGVTLITDRDRFIHVSGHPARDEVSEMYDLVRPRIVVPVHGEARHLNAHADFALNKGATFTQHIEDGDVLALTADGPRLVGKVPVGRLTLEGGRLVPMDSPILRDRRKMTTNGAAVVTLVMTASGNLVGEPLVTVHGLFNPEDDDAEAISLGEQVGSVVASLDLRARRDDEAVEEAARRVIRKIFNDDQGRRPITDVHLVRV